MYIHTYSCAGFIFFSSPPVSKFSSFAFYSIPQPQRQNDKSYIHASRRYLHKRRGRGGGRNIMWTLLGASLENPRIDFKSRLLFFLLCKNYRDTRAISARRNIVRVTLTINYDNIFITSYTWDFVSMKHIRRVTRDFRVYPTRKVG